MKKQIRKERGITLIALVVTIIVLLILAGVSLNAIVGENGILNQAQKASEKTKFASEKEAIELVLSEMKMNSYTNEENDSLVGEQLLDKKVGNSNWKVVLKDNNVYGTDWSFVKKGTEISGYGVLSENWLINYKTGEVIKLEDEKYSIISATDGLAVKNNIIFNLDSSVIDGNVPNTKEGLENSLGNGVELKGFDFDDNSGLTETSFKFDGIDDYIEMPFNEEIYGFDGGLTLEFYGKLLGKGLLRYEEDNAIYDRVDTRTLGAFFEIRNKNTNKGKQGLEFVFDNYEGKVEKICCALGVTQTQSYQSPFIR